ncbi:MAG: hypothetical protein KC731_08925, partial [Myxococcales bacterium]|nr:hypothetical protein [Myxococcales bacterium]
AFDAQRPPAVDSGWVQTRMVDLVRRATERTSSVVFRPGDGHGPVDEVRRNLDPNESSRWSIILSALILCLYAVIAGPVNFAIWRRRGRPLRALGWLPVIAGLTFGSVVVVGVAAKGCSGRARHLTVIEAGAGMTKGTARRWRGLFTPQAESLSVVARGETHTLGIAMTSITDAPHDELVIDRDGMRLEKVTVRPWKTLVIREDGLADLGDGISLTPEAGGAIRVTNRSGRRLRGLVVHNGHGVSFFHDSLDDGASVSTATMTIVSASTAAGYAFSVTRYAPYYIRDELDRAATGLADAWQAVQVAPVVERNWFPDDVPTLLGQLEGGEGTTRDSGLPVDSDRVLVRVVGWGGTP